MFLTCYSFMEYSPGVYPLLGKFLFTFWLSVDDEFYDQWCSAVFDITVGNCNRRCCDSGSVP